MIVINVDILGGGVGLLTCAEHLIRGIHAFINLFLYLSTPIPTKSVGNFITNNQVTRNQDLLLTWNKLCI